MEPFAGSLAVLLARPHAPKIETVNDVDCYLANFWRALSAAPEDVVRHADWPVNEADLSARHQWLVDQAAFSERMKIDAVHFDARIAGWWVWGLCSWIGSGWCDVQLPHLGNAGRGVNDYMLALAERLRRTRVACGDFERVLGDSVTWRHGTTGILLDPPYDLDGRAAVYATEETDVWTRASTWAAEHGADKRLRICLCGYEGTWTPPSGWTEIAWKAKGGYGGQKQDGAENVNAKRERLWFSPGCESAVPRQASLF